MRKNSVRKWLHAILDLLPLFVIPIFAIYTRNENYNSNIEIETYKSEVVYFNQIVQNGNFNNTNYWLSVRGDIQANDNVLSYTYKEVVTGIGNRIQQSLNTTANNTYIINLEVYTPHDTFY